MAEANVIMRCSAARRLTTSCDTPMKIRSRRPLSTTFCNSPSGRNVNPLRRSLSSTAFYDSQSGRTVNLPTGIQCHIGLNAVAIDRQSSAMQHLLVPGVSDIHGKSSSGPVKGIASVLHPVAHDAESVAEILDSGRSAPGIGGVLVPVSNVEAGVGAITAAHDARLVARALLLPELCQEAFDVQLAAASLGDAGAQAIFVSVDGAMDVDDLREMVDLACEVDLLDVPMRSRLGLRIKVAAKNDATAALKLAQHAHRDLELLHFYACLAGVEAPRPTELLPALGMKRPDFAFGKLCLAEHVPDAA